MEPGFPSIEQEEWKSVNIWPLTCVSCGNAFHLTAILRKGYGSHFADRSNQNKLISTSQAASSEGGFEPRPAGSKEWALSIIRVATQAMLLRDNVGVVGAEPGDADCR